MTTKALFSFASLRRLGPYFFSLLLTSDVLSPLIGSTPKSLRTSSVFSLKGTISTLLTITKCKFRGVFYKIIDNRRL
jgi:hypothetical protein